MGFIEDELRRRQLARDSVLSSADSAYSAEDDITLSTEARRLAKQRRLARESLERSHLGEILPGFKEIAEGIDIKPRDLGGLDKHGADIQTSSCGYFLKWDDHFFTTTLGDTYFSAKLIIVEARHDGRIVFYGGEARYSVDAGASLEEQERALEQAYKKPINVMDKMERFDGPGQP